VSRAWEDSQIWRVMLSAKAGEDVCWAWENWSPAGDKLVAMRFLQDEPQAAAVSKAPSGNRLDVERRDD